MLKAQLKLSIAPALMAAATLAQAAQLDTDARGAIPHDVQQLVVIDYPAMQNSPSAMNLRDRVMPPELKQFDEALRKSALNNKESMDQYVDTLAFALFRTSAGGDNLDTVGIAQGQFPVQDIMASFKAQKFKPTQVRSNSIYPMGRSGMVLCFVDPSTMVFGDLDAVKKALDARDGIAPSMLTNGPMMNAMQSVDSNPLWSILDNQGTQTMMRQLLGEAGSVTDFDSVKKRLQGSWYSMDFTHGVHLRPHHRHRRRLHGGHGFFAAERGRDGAQDEQLRRGEAGAGRNLHRLQRRTTQHSFRQQRCPVREPAAVAALPGHGALRAIAFQSGWNPEPGNAAPLRPVIVVRGGLFHALGNAGHLRPGHHEHLCRNFRAGPRRFSYRKNRAGQSAWQADP